MSSKVYELNGEEQSILEESCKDLQRITKKKVFRQDAIKQYTAEVEMLQAQARDHISYMSKRFGLTRIQVINKILAENKK